ncbi:MAG: seryl-tRNA synthetase, seryl-tRNA synthetase [Candidatus Parcubacteria bacterium]|jgi:seryl-tRNA synthetase
MLDIKFIRENADIVKEAARKKRVKVDIDALIKIDDERRDLMQKADELRAEQNKMSGSISREKDQKAREQMIMEMTTVKNDLGKIEENLKPIMLEWKKLMLEVPNVPDMSVPEGDSDAGNVEVKVVGEKPQFSFKPKDHIELLEKLDYVDFERGSKVSGFRGYFLKGGMTKLSFALWQYFLEKIVAKGYEPMIVPSLVRPELLYGSGYLPQGEEDLYKTQDGEYFAGTGEVATMGMYADEIIPLEKLPLKMVSFSPCFRREAGSHGKDVKGLIRVHEFFKLEMVILCEAEHEQSVKFHEELLANVEELIQDLKLHYHVVLNCGGDIGLGQVKKYDLEAWIPSQEKYRETHSASYFHDFQSRRLNIRYRDKEGKPRYVHSLNNTLVATPRILTAIVENYQTEDGKIRVPEVLKKYLNTEFL